MFGIYSNQRISEAERKILKDGPDDVNWYSVVFNTAFDDKRLFEVREDIEIPKKDDDDGVLLFMQGGSMVYFKTVDKDVGDEEASSILKVCNFLLDKFDKSVDVYVLCPHDASICISDEFKVPGVRLFFASFASKDGDEIVERLEAKLDRGEEFTYSDSIDHMLLPYSGSENKEVFQEKFKRYMKKVEEVGNLKNED